MTRRLLVIAVLFGVLTAACGKVGPPMRVRPEPTAAESPETTDEAGASAAEESKEEEEQP